jgi:hypothetical protein
MHLNNACSGVLCQNFLPITQWVEKPQLFCNMTPVRYILHRHDRWSLQLLKFYKKYCPFYMNQVSLDTKDFLEDLDTELNKAIPLVTKTTPVMKNSSWFVNASNFSFLRHGRIHHGNSQGLEFHIVCSHLSTTAIWPWILFTTDVHVETDFCIKYRYMITCYFCVSLSEKIC